LADGLTLAELTLAVLLVAALIPVVWLIARRRWLARSGWVFDCSLRSAIMTPSTWMLGVVRLNGELVEWYRVFSWSLRPKVTLRRGQAQPTASRVLEPAERALLVDQDRVVQLTDPEGRSVELAMALARMTAFLSWLEAAPPGSGYR